MHNRKHQKEIDKAISNLLKYSEQGQWVELQQGFYSGMFDVE